jgi:hypothetical protein
MINGTGKQAIKNAAAPVTISFASLQSSPLRPVAARQRIRRKTPSRAGNGGKIVHCGGEMGDGGNGTLTLSRHNRSQRGVPRAVWLVPFTTSKSAASI